MCTAATSEILNTAEFNCYKPYNAYITAIQATAFYRTAYNTTKYPISIYG